MSLPLITIDSTIFPRYYTSTALLRADRTPCCPKSKRSRLSIASMVLNVSGSDCDRFAAAMFAVAHYARDAVGLLLRYLIGGRCVALALFIRFPTGGAGIDSAVVGGIDKPVWH